MSTGGVAVERLDRVFQHEAFLYADLDEFLSGATTFIREGLACSEPTFVIVSAEKIAALRAALGGDQPGLSFADMAQVGHNPARIIPAWHDFVDAHIGPGVRLRGIGEPIGPDRRGAELVECHQHEAVLNLAFPEFLALWVLCPYDTTVLSPDVVGAARRNHPFLYERGSHSPTPDYRQVMAMRHPLGDPLDEPPEDASAMTYDPSCLTALREFVAHHARMAGLSADGEADLVLSVNEIAANSIQYAGGSGQLRIWRDGDELLCEVRDKGTITDPLVGRMAPGTSPESSRGLWVVNQLCDLVQVRSSSDGTVVRLHLSIRGNRGRSSVV